MTAELSTSGDDFSVSGGKITDLAAGVDPTDAANVSQIGGGGAPADADYLVGTANGGLSAEIVVGTTPGGELGGTWASPTVDATHSGSTHAAVQAAAEATAASALSAHTGDTSDAHDASAISADSTTLVGTGTDVQAVLEELDNGIADHLADTSAAHAASAVSVNSATLVGVGTDAQAVFEELDDAVATLVAGAGIPASIVDVKGDIIAATAADTVSRLAAGANDTLLVADSSTGTGLKWAPLPGGAQIPVSIIDAKGDLIVGTAADTAARLAVGADGTIPMADSGETTGVKWSPFTPRRAGGSSTSNTPGTSIADVNVTAGNKLVAWTVHAGQASAANTQITVTVTFADATTMALASVAATATVIIGNWGELLRIVSGVMNSSSAAGANKDVTRIQVTTLGTGTGARWAAISALEVWIP